MGHISKLFNCQSDPQLNSLMGNAAAGGGVKGMERWIGEATMAKVRAINDWLLPEELATPGATVLVLFVTTEGWRKEATDLVFAAAAEKHDGPIRFLRIDTDENPSVLKERKIRTLPTVIFFAEGEEVGRRTGPVGDQAIASLIARKEKKN